MTKVFKATPLFDAHRAFIRLPMGIRMLNDYPDSKAFLDQVSKTIPEAAEDFSHTQAFLKSYSRKSEATYRSYRNEVERLLLWTWTVAEKSVIALKRPDLESYFDFVHNPPAAWVANSVDDRFRQIGGESRQNKEWRPFVAKIAKQDRKNAIEAGKAIPSAKDGHTLSHEAMKICYSALSCFYDYLTDEGYAFGNPIPAIRKQSPFLIKGVTSTSIKRLSDLQWDYVLDCAAAAANKDPDHERTLFIVAMLKSLYLRISELSDRANWQPVWKHFWQDTDGNDWLKVLGKGNKIRDISVPNSLAPYIQRYQRYRQALSPAFGANAALVSKNRGVGGMTSRQLRRIVQQAFDLAHDKMRSEGFTDEAVALREATTHWLRHTGASQDIATRPLKHMADDLGHASMGTTDKVYIQSDMKERARTGKERDV
ncbi:MAG: site-specific integrase [Porticoccaceae bacterium]|nr:site-specific integrase [Porticoccaceae bacterium]|tara:strand:+ start:5938 stop:7215 length:1278 start_codon:yes stop_codon:yes gene_type:complete